MRRELNTETIDKAWMHQWSEAIAAWPKGGLATPTDHNDGNTDSEFTSWTTDRQVAMEKALDSNLGGQGVILQKDFDPSDLVASPDAYFESEILVRRLVMDALVTEVS